VKRVSIKGAAPPVFTNDSPQIIANLFCELKTTHAMCRDGLDNWFEKNLSPRTSKHSFTSLDSATDPFRNMTKGATSNTTNRC
jgi:hypothetical protein